MKPRRIRIPLAQRVFSGFLSETDEHVVVYGSFRFASYEKWLNIVFGAVITVFSLLILFRLPPLAPALAFFISLLLGAAFWGCLVGVSLLTSKRCEEDVIRLLTTLD